jgi:hypothetical protein
VCRLLGAEMIVDIDEASVAVIGKNACARRAAPKSINEEVRFLLKMQEKSFGQGSARKSNGSWRPGKRKLLYPGRAERAC